uniref:Uncharacterized protein n=1 Tax=Moniliophthora roreri TaxID=221103 RepID=A0A0W0FS52_MONRR
MSQHVTVRTRRGTLQTRPQDIIELSDSEDDSPQLVKRKSSPIPESGHSQRKRSKISPSNPSHGNPVSAHGSAVTTDPDSIKGKLAFNYQKTAETSTYLSQYYAGDDKNIDPVSLERMKSLIDSRICPVKNQMQLINATTMSCRQTTPPNVQPTQAIITRSSSSRRERINEQTLKVRLREIFGALPLQKEVIKVILQILQGYRVLTISHSATDQSILYFLAALSSLGEPSGKMLIVSSLLRPDDEKLLLLKRKGVNLIFWGDDSVPQTSTLDNKSKPDVLCMSNLGFLQSGKAMIRLIEDGFISRLLIDNASSPWMQKDMHDYVVKLGRAHPNLPVSAIALDGSQPAVEALSIILGTQPQSCVKLKLDRTNVHFSVYRKTNSTLGSITSFIRTKHKNHHGLVYCQKMSVGETLVEKLGPDAQLIHGQMPQGMKKNILDKWFLGQHQILVVLPDFDIAQVYHPRIFPTLSTTAYDVRVSIHCLTDTQALQMTSFRYFYQTSMTGGDGGPAECLLYYDCRDLKVISFRANEQRQVVDYCRHESHCRRVELLRSVGEDYAGRCNQSCDNCESNDFFVECDLSLEARLATELIKQLSPKNVPLRYCREVFAGHRTTEVRNNRDYELKQFGAGSHLPYDHVEQLFEELYLLGAWHEAEGDDQEWDMFTVKSSTAISQPLDRNFKLIVNVRGVPESHDHTTTPERTLPLYRDDTTDESSFVSLAAEPTKSAANSSDPVDHHQRSMNLFENMKTLRLTIRIELALPRDVDVLDDATLQMLSLTPPADYREFKKILKDCAPSPSEAQDDYVAMKWKQCGQRFLSVCIAVNDEGCLR